MQKSYLYILLNAHHIRCSIHGIMKNAMSIEYTFLHLIYSLIFNAGRFGRVFINTRALFSLARISPLLGLRLNKFWCQWEERRLWLRWTLRSTWDDDSVDGHVKGCMFCKGVQYSLVTQTQRAILRGTSATASFAIPFKTLQHFPGNIA